jgi:uncharacterized protein YjbI with pentapeptide repeats
MQRVRAKQWPARAVVAVAAALLVLTTLGAGPAGATGWNTLTGTVKVQQAGTPAAGTKVYLWAAATKTLLRSATTDVNGQYAITGIPDGQYKVQVFDPSGTYYGSWASNRSSWETAVLVTLGPAPTTTTTSDLSVFPHTGSLRGRLPPNSFCTVAAAVETIDGAITSTPLASMEGATVKVWDATYAVVLGSAVVDAAGAWSVAGLAANATPAGSVSGPRYKVSVTLAGATARWWHGGAGWNEAAPVAVIAGSSVDVCLPNSAPDSSVSGRVTNGLDQVAPGGGVISGVSTATNSTSTAGIVGLSGVNVAAVSSNQYGVDVIATTTTQPDGTFTLGSLPASTYHVSVTDPTWSNDHSTGYLPEWWGTKSSTAPLSGSAYTLAPGQALAIGDDGLAGHDCDPAWATTQPSLAGADLHGKFLTGCTFSNGGGADLTGANLAAADLTNADLTRSYLSGANVTGANLTASVLHGTLLQDAVGINTVTGLLTAAIDGVNLARTHLDLHGLDLRALPLDGGVWGAVNLSTANLHGANLSGMSLTGVNVEGADLGAANLSGAYGPVGFINANLASANLAGASFAGSALQGATWNGATLTNTNFQNSSGINTGHGLLFAKLTGANLGNTGVDWHGVNLSGRDLTGTNLAGAYLAGANLSGTKLSGAVLSHADVRNANFTNTPLVGANLSYASVTGATFTGSNLTNADLTAVTGINATVGLLTATLDHTSLGGTLLDWRNLDLHGRSLPGVNLDGAMLSGADLHGANLVGVSLSGVDLSGTNLSGATVSGANLSNTTFSAGTDVTNTDFHGSTFQRGKGFGLAIGAPTANIATVIFTEADITGLTRPGSNLAGVSFHWAVAVNTDFSGADLHGDDLTVSNFSGANLSNANLTGAHILSTLVGTNLAGATLVNANLSLSNLTNADLTGASLTGANLNNVVWSNTICPDGTNSDAHANTCVGHL